MTLSITDELVDQFHHTLEQLRDIVGKFPDEEWRKGTIDYMIPARLAYHLLFYGYRYVLRDALAADALPEGFARRWDAMTPEELPSREEVLALAGETEAAAEAWLRGLGDAGVLEPESAFPWTGGRPVIRAVYNLRHMEWHIGELNALLRERGYEQARW